ncbi:Flp pilus assembly protein TadG [Mycobacteroides abscessus subsp. abscessus]|nr:Flp pilus assembly protein TadG [Mycobacteroides abscessus subsp. abscessus]
MRRRRNQRGNAALEVLMLLPVIMVLAGLVIAYSRVAMATEAVSSAASAAARAAALERTPVNAYRAAAAVTDSILGSRELRCLTKTITVDTTGLSSPAGQSAQVTATVTCVVPFGDLGIPTKGTRTITHTATAPVDTYRGRGR